jgi:hypothetical protein
MFLAADPLIECPKPGWATCPTEGFGGMLVTPIGEALASKHIYLIGRQSARSTLRLKVFLGDRPRLFFRLWNPTPRRRIDHQQPGFLQE